MNDQNKECFVSCESPPRVLSMSWHLEFWNSCSVLVLAQGLGQLVVGNTSGQALIHIRLADSGHRALAGVALPCALHQWAESAYKIGNCRT